MSKTFSFLEFFVRLTGKYANHTGTLGAFEFKNGVSVRKLDRNQAQILPTVGFHCEAIDDDGDAVFPVIAGQVPAPNEALEEVRARFIASRKISVGQAAKNAKAAADAEQEKADAATAEAIDSAALTVVSEAPEVKEESEPTPEPEPEPEPKSAETGKYTREALEAIADKRGLKGLREIGEELGIKGKSIPELIDRILKGQK